MKQRGSNGGSGSARRMSRGRGITAAARQPLARGRSAEVERATRETSVRLRLNIDGRGRYEIETGVPFLNHMLEIFARHGFFDLVVTATGDLAVDAHHTVEDVGLTLGQAVREALGAKEGIRRFGAASVPLDEALVHAVVDLSGRPYLVYAGRVPRRRIGDFDPDLVHDFLQALVTQVGMNLHVTCERGRNPHHIVEATFKALARALDAATAPEPRLDGVLSTKGSL